MRINFVFVYPPTHTNIRYSLWTLVHVWRRIGMEKYTLVWNFCPYLDVVRDGRQEQTSKNILWYIDFRQGDELDDAKTIHTFLHLIVNTNCSYLNHKWKCGQLTTQPILSQFSPFQKLSPLEEWLLDISAKFDDDQTSIVLAVGLYREMSSLIKFSKFYLARPDYFTQPDFCQYWNRDFSRTGIFINTGNSFQEEPYSQYHTNQQASPGLELGSVQCAMCKERAVIILQANLLLQ